MRGKIPPKKEHHKYKMKNTIVKVSALLAIIAGLGIAGASAADPTTAITCSKCQDVIVVNPANTGSKPGNGYVLMTNKKTMVCPDCESAAQNFIKTGNLKHHCTHCDGTMETCTTH
jgi:hypothetical protein